MTQELDGEAQARRLRFRGGRLDLEIEDILAIVPQRPPLLLLDRVLSLVPGEHAVAVKNVCGEEAGLRPQRHGFVFPSTLVVEALSQLAQLVVSGVSVPPEAEGAQVPDADHWPRLVSIDALQVHQELVRPVPLHLTVSVLGQESDGGAEGVACAAQASAEGGLIVDARLQIARGGG